MLTFQRALQTDLTDGMTHTHTQTNELQYASALGINILAANTGRDISYYQKRGGANFQSAHLHLWNYTPTHANTQTLCTRSDTMESVHNVDTLEDRT